VTRPALTISLPYDPPPGLEAEIYADLGVVASVYRTRALPDVTGSVVVVAALTQLSSAFLGEAGKDTYQGLRRLIDRLHKADTSKAAGLRLTDRDTGVTFDVGQPAQGDDRAWQELGRTDRKAYRRGTILRWDPKTGRWNSGG